ncbi:MAG: glucose 1-dehydrogenase [Hylemonella sp.]|nr:glucose 1-dehydrogenase [Hylemonella sp.]MDH5708587.1 glucose 1-dehydrogenase [Hylemonella sp.]
MDLRDRVALITGGNSGIGLGMAQGLAGAGASLVIVGRSAQKNADAAQALQAQGAQVLTIEADVTQEDECNALVSQTVSHFGRLDILVNNAGINIRKPPQDYTLDEWRAVLDTNLTSAFLCSKAAYPAMLAAGGGKIINTGSMTSIFGASFAMPYSASKGGIVQLSKALATAWAKDNIQVNAILPGWIDTALTRQARIDVPGLNERVLTRTAAGRWGTPEDFAGIAVFLASRASDFVTGAAIPVDGGYSSQA